MQTGHWWSARRGSAPTFVPLEGDLTTDVCVVGGGITGITVALLLARGGRQVVLLEADRVGSGTTGQCSAHLTVVPDTPLPELRRRVGDSPAMAVVAAGRSAIERIASFDTELGGRGGLRRVPGFLWARTLQELDEIEHIADDLRAAGERVESPVEVPLPGGARGLRIEEQAWFDPLGYLFGLAELAVGAGVRIHDRTTVVGWGSGPRYRIATTGGEVLADELVLATHSPPGFVPSVQTRMAPYDSYVITARIRGVLNPGLYWDLAVPYHYVRPLPDGRLLIGGADARHGDGDPRDRLAVLEEWAVGRLPVVGVDERWVGELFEPADGLPYVGRLPGRVGAWVATGFAGTGLTLGTFAAERIAAGLLGHEREEDGWFSPRRMALVGGLDRMAEDNADVAWKMIADRLRPTGDLHPADLAPGEGRLMTVDGRRVAVWRDPQGPLHLLSPVCRHLGCIVRWNGLDQTWDCPCHGGRYAADGRRLYGPPTRDLERRTVE